MKPATRISSLRAVLHITLAAVFITAAVAVYLHRQYIVDQLTVWQHSPSDEVRLVAEKTAMSERGSFLFYASKPQLQDKATFSTSCSNKEASSYVLGCYSGGVIYVYNIQDKRINGVREVTAAHEMLHVAYARMSDEEKKEVERAVEATYQSSKKNADLNARLKIYEKIEPGERINELFAIFGTEFRAINPRLEAIYRTYFTDRSKVVALSESYQAVFVSLETRAAAIEAEAASIASTRNGIVDGYNQASKTLQADVDRFTQERSTIPAEAATEQARQLNTRIARLQTEYESLARQVEQYDQKIEELKKEYDGISTTQKQLHSNLDSRLSPSSQTEDSVD